MALQASTVWEFQTGGSDNNGGGFTSGGTDYSQQTASQLSLTDLSTLGAGATTITTILGTFTSAMVGNIIFIRSSTSGFQVGFYEIITFTDATNVILDRTPSSGAAGVAGVAEVGGCRNLISSNSFATALVAGNKVWIKTGSYTLAAFTGSTVGTATEPIFILGYNTTRDDNPTGANSPTLIAGANAFVVAQFYFCRNFIFTTSQATGIGINADSLIENCKVTSTNATATNGAITLSSSQGKVINCEAINASGVGIKMLGANGVTFGCYIHDSTTGILCSSNSRQVIVDNIISGNTTGISFSASAMNFFTVINNTIFGAETPAGTGILGTAATAPVDSMFVNNIIYGFVTGVNWTASTPQNYWNYNDFFNNTTDRTNVTAGPNDVAINPGFTNAAGGNFAISGAI